MSDGTATCQEKFRLLLEFQQATRRYSHLVSDLAKLAGSVPKVEFEFLSRAATKAHEACLAAREQFYTHLSDHQC